jgi:hypothetical protein
MPSMFLPEDAEKGIAALLAGLQLSDGEPVNVGSIGQLTLDDNDQLVFDPPMARTYYAGSPVYRSDENQALAYQDVRHIVEVWCYVESLRSKEEQRDETIQLLGQVLPILAGARIPLSDKGASEPVRILNISGVIDVSFGKIYIVSVEVPGIAQFPGPK